MQLNGFTLLCIIIYLIFIHSKAPKKQKMPYPLLMELKKIKDEKEQKKKELVCFRTDEYFLQKILFIYMIDNTIV